MNKFLAVVKREYVQRVRSRMFIVATVLGPLMLVLFTVVPAYIAGIKTGGPTRLAIVDQSGKLSERLREVIVNERDEEDAERERVAAQALNESSQERMEQTGKSLRQSYDVQQVAVEGTIEETRRRLDERIRRDELDGYLVLPADILQSGEAEYHARNTGDVFTRGQIKNRLTTAVRDQRMAERNILPSVMREVNSPVNMRTTKAGEVGGKEDSGQGFYLVFAVGFIIYLTILMYGQVILGAVIEEKETRIAEILFSSVRAFPLMMGKLIGVSLVALTQFLIWGVVFGAFALYGTGMLAAQGMPVSIPRIAPSLILYFLLFFLLGYFIYSTIYALVGAMVTTAQEGGQLALPIILLLVTGFYLAFPVIRSPNSSFAFWVSMFPFFSPITMLVRIVTQTPPFWQIALSLFIGFGTVVLLMWLAARIYRVGMLMYGKRASIPEVLRWVRQA
ncbi:MAG TPA: ABC transporter permease [Pyrinomonadaceae bacterium]|nr:ABC transporter permease [Pyrinomonadaceae bacterium]